MEIRESAENYLETILMLNRERGSVRSVDIATKLGFSKPSVSVAMKNLRENGYVLTDPDGVITLTEKGLEVAEKTYRRHVVLTNGLTRLGVPPEIAEEDACRIEHIISEETFEAISSHFKE